MAEAAYLFPYFNRTLGLPVLLVAVMLSGGCSTGKATDELEERDPADVVLESLGLTRESLEAKIVETVDAAMQGSDLAESLQLPDGSLLTRRTAKVAATTTINIPNILPTKYPIPAPLGVLSGRIPEEPTGIVTTDSGSVYIAFPKGLVHWDDKGGSRTLLNEAVSHLQLNASGERLVLELPGRLAIYTTSDQQIVEPSSSSLPEGKPWWLADDKLLMTRETLLDFSASTPQRVSLEAIEWSEATGAINTPEWDISEFAVLGTLPVMGIIWGQLATSYHINPMPAPILLVEEGDASRVLTLREDCADLLPSASTNGYLAWTRTWRYGGQSARGMFHHITDPNGKPVQFTAQRTGPVALSPDGERIVYTLQDASGWQVWTTPTIDVVNLAMNNVYAQRDEKFRNIIWDIRKALGDYASTTSLKPILKETDGALELTANPDPAVVTALGSRLQSELLTRFEIDPTNIGPILPVVDHLMDELGDYMEEEPINILALAGLFIANMNREASWLSEDELKDLGVDETLSIRDEGLGLVGINPFFMARERIGGRVSLTGMASQVEERINRAVWLTGSLSDGAMTDMKAHELVFFHELLTELDGSKVLTEVKELESPPTALLEWLSEHSAATPGHDAVALFAALEIANRHRIQPEALLHLGRALMRVFLFSEAAQIFKIAMELDPENLILRIGYTDAMIAMEKLDVATKQIAVLEQLDGQGEFEGTIASRKRLVEELKSTATGGTLP